MKRILATIFLVFMVLCGTVTYAQEDRDVYSYSIKYNTDCDTEIREQTAVTRAKNTIVAVTRTIPKKPGYVFLGWSLENKHMPKELFLAGERMKINSSVELFAVWKLENSLILEYEDGGKNILPSQVVIGGEAEISSTIPRKTGYIFCGWQNDAQKDIWLPGDKIEMSKDVSLKPIWKREIMPQFGLEVASFEDGKVVFKFQGTEYFATYELVIKNLADGEEISFENPTDDMTTDTLMEGQYKAWVEIEKSGMKYKSPSVDFVVHSGVTDNDAELRLFMEGKELFFDMPPVLLESHTYIALRHFCESMGARVEWSDADRCATIIYNGTMIKVFENENRCILNGETRFLPVPTRILSSSMFIPLRSIAELCDCEIIWDSSRKVYVFKGQENIFEDNILSIMSENGKFLSLSEEGLCMKDSAGFEGAWVFDCFDEENGIYEIYNLNNLTEPLSVKRSEVFDGQSLVIEEKDSFDGFLWRVEKTEDGRFVIKPANNRTLYLDAEGISLSKDVVYFEISSPKLN